jgi:hypothetical protein
MVIQEVADGVHEALPLFKVRHMAGVLSKNGMNERNSSSISVGDLTSNFTHLALGILSTNGATAESVAPSAAPFVTRVGTWMLESWSITDQSLKDPSTLNWYEPYLRIHRR